MYKDALCASSSVRLAFLSLSSFYSANTQIKTKGKLALPDSFDRQHMIVTALAVGSF